ncbi:MAG: hypothetical protein ABSG02_02995 [Terriglobales bacterium]|jgi:hypothetical protein
MMETLHAVIAIVGAVAMLAGIGLAVWGTYLLTQSYHPFSQEGLIEHLKDAPLLAIAYLKYRSQQGRTPAPAEPSTDSPAEMKPKERSTVDDKIKELQLLAEMALVNKENRPLLLLGTDMVFIGFIFQVFGAMLTVVDVMWSRLARVG